MYKFHIPVENVARIGDTIFMSMVFFQEKWYSLSNVLKYNFFIVNISIALQIILTIN